ncbi:membrane protein [Achromatium sp. WMS2]|nr:membrane protein [Achromatium sp. WMS2]
MKIFSTLYKYAMEWARHPQAHWYLVALSFAESSFFPIPPDVMLAPMSLARPERAWWLATITTGASVLGGALGYAIGWFAFDLVQPLIVDAGYLPLYQRAQEWYQAWGFIAVLIAAFTPIPYKMFTIAAGAMNMSFLPFMLASVIGRGGRMFLVAALMAWGGPGMEQALHKYVDRIGWITILVLAIAMLIYYA